MSENSITIRLETKDDYRNVENLTRESFWNVYRPGCTEHYVLHCYRDDPAFVPELDFVMELNGVLIGQVLPFILDWCNPKRYSHDCIFRSSFTWDGCDTDRYSPRSFDFLGVA